MELTGKPPLAHTALATHSVGYRSETPASQASHRGSWGMEPLVRNIMATLGTCRSSGHPWGLVAGGPAQQSLHLPEAL